MRSDPVRLPNRFPAGTRYVVEGRNGRIKLHYLEFPDGRHLDLPADPSRRTSSRRSSRRQRAPRK